MVVRLYLQLPTALQFTMENIQEIALLSRAGGLTGQREHVVSLSTDNNVQVLRITLLIGQARLTLYCHWSIQCYVS